MLWGGFFLIFFFFFFFSLGFRSQRQADCCEFKASQISENFQIYIFHSMSLYACIYGCHVGIVPVEARRWHQNLVGVMDSCEPPCGCWKLNPGPLQEQPVLLPTELVRI